MGIFHRASGDIDMSDLVRIAKYHNKYVIGYSSGKKHTSNLLKKCCDEFIICFPSGFNNGITNFEEIDLSQLTHCLLSLLKIVTPDLSCIFSINAGVLYLPLLTKTE